jgi:hypothetical protein
MSMILNPCLHAGGGFTPSDIHGLVLWIDPEEDGFTDGTLVSSAGNYGSGGQTITASGALRPECKTGIANGRRIFRFASGQSLSVSSPPTGFPFTVFCVMSQAVLTSGRSIWGSGDTSEWATNNALGRVNFVFGGISQTRTFLVANQFRAAATKAVTSGNCYIDIGTATNTLASDDGSGNLVALHIGSFDGASKFWNGDIAEFLLWNVALSNAEITQVMNWAYDRYNL